MSEHGAETGGFGWEDAEDLTALSEEELKKRFEGLVEERAVGYRRRILQGSMDLIRGGLLHRGSVALPPEELVRVLMGEEGRP
jgi:hypothetical protein